MRSLYHSQLTHTVGMVSLPNSATICTVTLPVSDFRLLIACVYEAQHHQYAFQDRRTDEHLSKIVQTIHRAMTSSGAIRPPFMGKPMRR